MPIPMPIYDIELIVTPRPGVRDPQGEAVQEALRNLGHGGVQVDGVGRVLRMRVPAADAAAATALVKRMCDELLVNSSLETFQLSLPAGSPAGSPAGLEDRRRLDK